MATKIPEELISTLHSLGDIGKPITEFGQTVEGGHNWQLTASGVFDTWNSESYPYCMRLHCTECYADGCNKGCDGWDVFLEKCEESDWKNRQGTLF